jgi:NDP-sugar pyrophosphorylase family protein
VALRPAPSTALLLTAGLGTRLRPLTDELAKPALPVAGATLVERIVLGLRRDAVTDLLLNLHYLPSTITRVVGDGAGLGVRVRYSWEMPLLGSGGGPRRAFSLVSDDRLWLINGDTLSDVDLRAMGDEHAQSDALVTMAVIPNPAPDRYGGVVVDRDGAVIGFVPRGAPGPTWHFVGVQIAERAAFASLADGVPAESVAGVYRSLMSGRHGAVRAFRAATRFLDIGTPRDYLDACLAIAGTTVVAPASARVAPSARLSRAVLWDAVGIGENVMLDEVVVARGVQVPPGFRAARAVLTPGSGAPTVTPFA